MLELGDQSSKLVGPSGTIEVPSHDEITKKIAMLYEGRCEGLGPTRAAQKHGYTKQRYFQLLRAYEKLGARGLQNQKRGPKTNYRRTTEVVRQVIRYRFLDPDASAPVIAQKLRQSGWEISTRSVQRVIAEFGLQKKTPQISS